MKLILVRKERNAANRLTAQSRHCQIQGSVCNRREPSASREVFIPFIFEMKISKTTFFRSYLNSYFGSVVDTLLRRVALAPSGA